MGHPPVLELAKFCWAGSARHKYPDRLGVRIYPRPRPLFVKPLVLKLEQRFCENRPWPYNPFPAISLPSIYSS
jgi:hypothetical protein